ncbi:hypothetical protein K435DRAFT_627218, partial [Dendrothele bispora CBS 962.96]
PRIVEPIVPFNFTPFPVPSQPSVPGVFVPTDPSDPPEVFNGTDGNTLPIVPDFADAWDAAFEKAKNL